ncbi:thiamine-phosphate synthase [Clostridium botulinum A2B7 92]|uniref:Thiamine-phosphate synthase n=2 Tax=Clostridium botulinum TaxID=1491 RepID=THIE_CLOBM|nr:thiamine phosphate synthase [Clostridium botulinum]B1KV12.1 RecName: Full=Thiamine-phosphate synthase; Short=TP synthase; Short=TPS; AltName: Full=Thiamine-phosphate pyrophosphorylase; Short=TMP pyrophosphorylase; Short=TMP-PPase [Clostridium botulinum A3 str. Loch Maree]ACA56025.1 thiamine-phosphate diphosphorylase [Clostridium botulinum A3 str. Loch Maree]KEJ03411.1 thiamine-phosphate synthase [Clostridium botulinum A2B7 92]NFH67057.1 thiamine phosphate synthase [Clostridium botulinum]NFJ
MEINYGLYLITDRRFLKGRQLKKVVEDAILGGVTIVQVREKDVSTREFYNVAKEVKEVTDYYKVPIIINDRLDIAQAIDANGVHLGQKDMHLNIAREILGKDKIIGISVGNVKEALEAQNNGADYLGIGTIFPTGSKKDVDAIIGIDGLSKIKDSISIPSVAIGGINKTNFKDVLKTGIEGISVISAILDEDDIKLAANNLLINK